MSNIWYLSAFVAGMCLFMGFVNSAFWGVLNFWSIFMFGGYFANGLCAIYNYAEGEL